MLRHLRTLLAALAVVGMLAVPVTSAFASTSVDLIENKKASPMIDLLLMRPLGLIMLGASAALWVPAQTATMIVSPREYRVPIEFFLKKPAEFVFRDRLGMH
jgi:hypothetical protein